MHANSKVDVLIVGAGPTGLALACDLVRRKVSFRIIDKNGGPSSLSKALGVQARTLEELSFMDLAAPMIAKGLPVSHVGMYTGKDRMLQIHFERLDSPYPFLLMLPQSDTEAILLDRLEANEYEVERGTELVTIEQSAEGVRANVLRNGLPETIECSFAVGCDGAHSAVRHQLGVSFEGKEYAEHFVLADATVRFREPLEVPALFPHHDGPLALFPLPNGRTRIVAPLHEAPSNADETPNSTTLHALVASRVPFECAIDEPEWSAYFRIHERLASKIQVGRIFLAGDAAHIHSPAGGQGMNTGIQDVLNLGWKLGLVVQGKASIKLLESYQEERYPVEKSVLRSSDLLTRVMTLHSTTLEWIRNKVMQTAMSIDAVQDRAAASLSELAISYPASSIVEAHDGGDGPAAGDRIADITGLSSDGRAVRMFELLQGPQHHLFVIAGEKSSQDELDGLLDFVRGIYRWTPIPIVVTTLLSAASGQAQSSIRAVLDAEGKARKYFGATRSMIYLIRPDGYVGFLCSAAKKDKLREYLQRVTGHNLRQDS